MATDTRLGTRIRRAIERKRMTQQEVADALGVSRSAVNAWVNDRTEPLNAIGALEELLDVDLTAQEEDEVYTDPAEAELWSLTTFTEDERRELIRAYRDGKRQRKAG